MKSLQDMITEIHAATDAEGTSYKSIQDMQISRNGMSLNTFTMLLERNCPKQDYTHQFGKIFCNCETSQAQSFHGTMSKLRLLAP